MAMQNYKGEPYDTGEVVTWFFKHLGLEGRTKWEHYVTIFQTCRDWSCKGQARYASNTAEGDTCRHTATGWLPDCAFDYYLAHRAPAPA